MKLGGRTSLASKRNSLGSGADSDPEKFFNDLSECVIWCRLNSKRLVSPVFNKYNETVSLCIDEQEFGVLSCSVS